MSEDAKPLSEVVGEPEKVDYLVPNPTPESFAEFIRSADPSKLHKPNDGLSLIESSPPLEEVSSGNVEEDAEN